MIILMRAHHERIERYRFAGPLTCYVRLFFEPNIIIIIVQLKIWYLQIYVRIMCYCYSYHFVSFIS